MSKKEVILSWKNPMYRTESSYHPAGNILKELQEEEQHSIAGGTITLSTCAILSKPLGNNGYLCTVTKECMPSCN